MVRTVRWVSVLGVVLIVVALAALHAWVVAEPTYSLGGGYQFGWRLAWIVVLVVALYTSGLPDQPPSAARAAGAAALAAGASALVVSVLQLAVGDALLPRFVVFGSALAVIPWEVGCNVVARGGRRREVARDRVLLVGADDELSRLAEDLRDQPERPALLVGNLASGAARDSGALEAACRERSATVVVLDLDAQGDDQVIDQAARLHEAGIRIRTLQAFYANWLAKLPLSDLERSALFFDIGEVHRIWYLRTKRLIDTLVAVAGLFVLVAVTPFVVVGDLVANRGPLLYRQVRVGKGGEPFTMLKFRTMVATEGEPTPWTSETDPRVTPFGGFLRRTHLDELPQVLNILRGDLAVVGPRPEQPQYVAELSAKLPFYDLRHLVRPGLTGWAQVKHGYAADEQDALEKLQYEMFYLQHQGVGFDLRIMARTIRSVVRSDGR